MNNILCFGECNVDITIPNSEIPEEGYCSFSSDVVMSMGGSVLNTAVALNHLKLKPIIISQLGEDNFGALLYSFLEEQRISTAYIKKTEYPTGVVVSLISPNGETRHISVRKNAADIHIAEYDPELLKNSNVLYISGVELTEGGESRETAIKMACQVKAKGGMVFLDPNIHLDREGFKDDVRLAFERIYPYTYALLPNEKELLLLGDNLSVHESSLSILSKGVSSIWVKLGEKGCTYYTKNSSITFPTNKVNVINNFCAGDAFNAAVIFSTVSKFSAEATGSFANLFACYIISRPNASQALPDETQIKSMIQNATGDGSQ